MEPQGPIYAFKTSSYIRNACVILTSNCTTAEMAAVTVKPVDKCWDME